MTNELQIVVENLNALWNTPKHTFPGPQPVSIERKNFTTLKSMEYLIGHKNDGERYALCFIRHNDKPRCFLLNRTLGTTYISLLVSRKLYEGSIFDCELIDNNLHIFDCPLFAGKSLKSVNFLERLSYCKTFISALRTRDSDGYTFSTKQFVSRLNYNQLEKCEKSDGYIFVPLHKPVQTGTHMSYFKWKPLLQNTIDFAMCEKKKVYLQNAGKLCKSKVELDLSEISCESIEFVKDTVILECQFVSADKWKALHIRHDKVLPNSSFTFKKTLINIEENVKFSELVS
tara:strand:+ start:3997 stop:4857 length:861 start_codon:yes stop_codon:yes gene_type:complete